MEHRYSLRRPMKVDIVMNYRRLGLVRGRSCNVGMGGMYVETGRIQIPVNAMVDVSVLLDTVDGACAFQTEAIVVHMSEGGVGLMFSDLRPGLHDLLHELIYNDRGRYDENGRLHLAH